MDFIEQMTRFDPEQDPFIQAYQAWRDTGALGADILEILGERGNTNAFSFEDFARQGFNFIRRDAFIERFGFCVPLPPLVEFLVANGPVLEIGAGRGFIAHLVAQSGGEIRATDLSPSADHVEQLSAADAIRQDAGASLVFCTWPSLEGDWFGDALTEMKKDQRLLYIGEGPGGATASETFFSQIGTTLLPQPLPEAVGFNFRFHGIHDHAELFVRA